MQRLFDDPRPPLGAFESTCNRIHQTHFVITIYKKPCCPLIISTFHLRTRMRQMNDCSFICCIFNFLAQFITGRSYFWCLVLGITESIWISGYWNRKWAVFLWQFTILCDHPKHIHIQVAEATIEGSTCSSDWHSQAIWGLVSCPRHFSHVDCKSWGSNHNPFKLVDDCSTSWATATPKPLCQNGDLHIGGSWMEGHLMLGGPQKQTKMRWK